MRRRAEPAWAIGVVIPANNEDASIARCIGSVIGSFAHCPPATDLWVVVVADDCSDATARRARAALGAHGEVIECRARSPGSARRLGAARILERYRGHALNRVWLANTDADSCVPPEWLPLQLRFAEDGETAVAGIIELDALSESPARAIELFRETYHIASDGSHAHVHGANLGVRADAYVDVGGWSHRAVAEDHCLWSRLKIAGWRMRASANSVVLTSARLNGRARGGFADSLRAQWEATRD